MKKHKQMFTDEQLKEYIVTFFKNNHQIPSFSCISGRLGGDPKASIMGMRKLEKDGFIKKNVVGNYMFTRMP